MEGQPCYLCRAPVYTKIEPFHPDTMTLHRITPGGPYTMENVTVAHYQCNSAMGRHSRDETIERLRAIYSDDDSHGPHLRLSKRRRHKLISDKRARAKRRKVDFTLDVAWLGTQLDLQMYRCWLCGMHLNHDISFDQCPPGAGYHPHTTRLAHTRCNMAKFTSYDNLMRICERLFT